MDYDRLGPERRRAMVDERIESREEELFQASLDLAEAVGGPSEVTYQEMVDDLEAKITALKAERDRIS